MLPGFTSSQLCDLEQVASFLSAFALGVLILVPGYGEVPGWGWETASAQGCCPGVRWQVFKVPRLWAGVKAGPGGPGLGFGS